MTTIPATPSLVIGFALSFGGIAFVNCGPTLQDQAKRGSCGECAAERVGG